MTDLTVGPDRALYVVSIATGTVYRIAGAIALPLFGLTGIFVLALALGGAAAIAISRRSPRPSTGG
jgi:hypothetical protein